MSFFSGDIDIDDIKEIVNKIFVRPYQNETEQKTKSFEEAWDSETSNEMPWESLKQFEKDSKKSILNSVYGEMEEEEDNYSFKNSRSSGEVWSSWYNLDEDQWYFGECPECNIPDRD